MFFRLKKVAIKNTIYTINNFYLYDEVSHQVFDYIKKNVCIKMTIYYTDEC